MSHLLLNLFGFFLFFLAQALTAAQQPPLWSWHGPLERNQILEIRNTLGSIAVRQGPTLEVSVWTTRPDRARDVAFESWQKDSRRIICPQFSRMKEDQCSSDRGWSQDDVKKYSFPLRIEVALPPGIALVARSFSSAVEARDLASDVTVDTFDGAIEISSTGRVVATSMTGSIVATVPDKPSNLSAFTHDGNIRLALPPDCRASIEARTSAGQIHSDLPLRIDQGPSGRVGSHSSSGAAAKLRLESWNGDVEVISIRRP